jgi:hypothetical protein
VNEFPPLDVLPVPPATKAFSPLTVLAVPETKPLVAAAELVFCRPAWNAVVPLAEWFHPCAMKAFRELAADVCPKFLARFPVAVDPSPKTKELSPVALQFRPPHAE